MIRRGKHQSEYATIPNALANDAALSFEHRGLLLYLLAKPENWCVRVADLCKQGGIGRNKAYRLLTDLEAAGYLVRERARDESGQLGEVDYVVFDQPNMQGEPRPQNQHMVESPRPCFPDVDNPHVENGDHTKERTSTNAEEGKKPEGSSVEIEQAVLEYQLIAEQIGLSKIVKLSEGRRKHLKARLAEHGLETWRAAMRRVPASAFLCGKNDRRWRPDFDWFVNPTNFLKLIEGKYHDGKPIAASGELTLVQPSVPRDAERERWVARLKAWAESGYWTDDWGPAPGDPRCEAPRDLVELHRKRVSA